MTMPETPQGREHEEALMSYRKYKVSKIPEGYFYLSEGGTIPTCALWWRPSADAWVPVSEHRVGKLAREGSIVVKNP